MGRKEMMMMVVRGGGLLGSQASFVLPLYFGLSLYSLRSCYFLTCTPPPSSSSAPTFREGLWALGCFVRLSAVLLAPTKYINERSGA